MKKPELLIACTFAVTVSFLNPFFMKMAYAQQAAASAEAGEAIWTEAEAAQAAAEEKIPQEVISQTGESVQEEQSLQEEQPSSASAGDKAMENTEDAEPEEAPADTTGGENTKNEEMEMAVPDLALTGGEGAEGTESMETEQTVPEPAAPETMTLQESVLLQESALPQIRLLSAETAAVYEYSGGMQSFTAPAGGKYRICCYGAPGGGQSRPAGDLPGGMGSMTQGVIRLQKGETLYLFVGGNGSSGGRCSHGSPGGNSGGYNGGAASDYDEGDLGNHGRYWTHGSGGGASDVRLGGSGIENRIIVAGGGGGANKETRGYAADSGRYNGRKLYGSKESGGGGYYGGNAHQGGSSYIDEAHFTEISRQNGSSSRGMIVIETVSLLPEVRLTAGTDWTNQRVMITADVQPGGELPEQYLCWQKKGEEGKSWTADTVFWASENGEYICKIRDTDENIEEYSIRISNIDRLSPKAQIIADSREWTNKPVLLQAAGADAEATQWDGKSDLPEQAYQWRGGSYEAHQQMQSRSGTLEMAEAAAAESTDMAETESEELKTWTLQNELTVSENGCYVCLVRDRAGNTAETLCQVDWIDVTPPEVTWKRNGNWYEGSTELIVTAKDLQPDGTEGCGLAAEAYSTDGITFTKENRITVSKEGAFTVWVRDRLGNIKKQELVLQHDRSETGDDKGSGKEDGNKGKEEIIPEPLPEEILLPGTAVLMSPPAENSGGSGRHEPAVQEKKRAKEKTGGGRKPFLQMFPAELSAKEKPGKDVPGIAAETKKDIGPEKEALKNPGKRKLSWQKKVLYSIWMSALLCGLLWLLSCLLLEHVIVFEQDKKGRYKRIGICAILRKRDYKQINICRMTKDTGKKLKIRFSACFVFLHRNDKVLLRTWSGVELRNVAKEIEILSCNSGNHVLI